MIVADVAEFARLLNVDNRDGTRQTCFKFQPLILSSQMVDIMIHMCIIMMWIFGKCRYFEWRLIIPFDLQPPRCHKQSALHAESRVQTSKALRRRIILSMKKSIAGESIPYNLHGIKLPETHLVRLPDLYRNIITGFAKNLVYWMGNLKLVKLLGTSLSKQTPDRSAFTWLYSARSHRQHAMILEIKNEDKSLPIAQGVMKRAEMIQSLAI